ncbi:MAG: capsular polysaccharide synthesis protein [Bacteroidales bacterium]|nr:capsular polysaccharide synthesis protein [Bacteroidales bacterium]
MKIREVLEKIAFFFYKVGRMPRQMRTTRKRVKEVPTDLLKQVEIAKKLDGYIDNLLNGKIEKYIAVAKKPELVGKKIIWQYWQQGLDENLPKLVKVCFASVEKYRGEYEVIILSKETLNDYIEMPDFVWEKFDSGGFTFPKVSNLVRLHLLSAYGGVWLDAALYMTAPIDKRFLKMDFFALQRSEIPPKDLKIFTKYDPIGLSWDPESYVRMLNGYMIAKPHHKIIDDLLSIHLEYWKKEEDIGHYFFFQIMFYQMVQRDEWKDLNCEIVSYADLHRFCIAGFERFNQRYYDEVTARWNIHRVPLHWARRKKELIKNSFADVIVNEKLERP